MTANNVASEFEYDYRIPQTLENKMFNKKFNRSLMDLQEYLERSYTKNVTAEFEHVKDEAERLWLYNEYEKVLNDKDEKIVTKEEQIKALQLLHRAEQMELYLQKRFATHKRYSGEGSESLIVALNTLLAEASKPVAELKDQGIDSAVLCMPHRGRLETLVVLNDYPMRNLLYKVAGNNDMPVELDDRTDDIPTHIAVSNSKKFSTTVGSASSNNKKVTLTMIHNPSHLES